MSFNGSGTFVINSAGQPVVANTVISATVFNALTADLATGLTNCITKDGQSTPTANIPMGNNKITGLGAGTAATDAATLGQVQSTAAKLISVTGTDTISGTMSPALTAYAAGQLFYFIANAANTGAMTINIDGLGAKNITRDGSTALVAGDVNSGEIVVICYDGTRFQMINAANSFGNTTINGTLTVTGNTALQANVSVTSALSVGGVFAVTGAATLGSTLAVTGKSDLPTVSTASMNAAVAVVTTGTVTNLTATSASVASMNAGVALLTTATVTTLNATGASIASANIGNLQFTAASIASINAGVAVVTNLTATSASIASANVGTAVITTGTLTNLTATSASVASVNAGVALITTGTVTSLTATGASVASANVGTAVVTGLTVTGASIASMNGSVANITTVNATTVDATNVEVTNVKAKDGTAAITIADSTGNVGIGGTANATDKVTIAGTLPTSSNVSNGFVNRGTIPSGTTSSASIFRSGPTTEAASFTITVLNHFIASPQAFGAGSTVTGQYGFFAQSNLTGATNNYGFYSAIASGSGRYNFYAAGSADNYFAGNVGIGTSSPTRRLDVIHDTLYQFRVGTSAANSYDIGRSAIDGYLHFYGNQSTVNGYVFEGIDGTRMTIDASGNVGIGTTPAAKLDVYNSAAAAANNEILRLRYTTSTTAGHGGDLNFTNQDGIIIGRISSIIEDGSNVGLGFSTYSSSVAQRVLISGNGNVGIGGAAAANEKVRVAGTLPTASNRSRSFVSDATIPSGTTTDSIGYFSIANTQAASFTLTTLAHFYTYQNAFTGGSAVTNQYGYFVDSTLTGATNNYGFYSNIASGSNRWNFYAAGTARNYFAGRTDVGNTRIVASNSWNGVQLDSGGNAVVVADGATVTLTSTTCAAVTVHVYDDSTGNGGVFFATYSTTVTKIAGDGEATDTGSTFAVYKSAGSHTLTFKNKYGGAARAFRIAVFAANAE